MSYKDASSPPPQQPPEVDPLPTTPGSNPPGQGDVDQSTLEHGRHRRHDPRSVRYRRYRLARYEHSHCKQFAASSNRTRQQSAAHEEVAALTAQLRSCHGDGNSRPCSHSGLSEFAVRPPDR